jgi:hypothetical protein
MQNTQDQIAIAADVAHLLVRSLNKRVFLLYWWLFVIYLLERVRSFTFRGGIAMPLFDRVIKEIQDKNSKDTHLDLAFHGLFDKDMEQLVNLLNETPRITSIDLHGNNIWNAGGTLAKLLHVSALNLYRNSLSFEGISALAESNIKNLNLKRNSLTDAAGAVLATQSKQLQLDVSENRKITEETLQLITQRIIKNNEKPKNAEESDGKNDDTKKANLSLKEVEPCKPTFFTTLTVPSSTSTKHGILTSQTAESEAPRCSLTCPVLGNLNKS